MIARMLRDVGPDVGMVGLGGWSMQSYHNLGEKRRALGVGKVRSAPNDGERYVIVVSIPGAVSLHTSSKESCGKPRQWRIPSNSVPKLVKTMLGLEHFPWNPSEVPPGSGKAAKSFEAPGLTSFTGCHMQGSSEAFMGLCGLGDDPWLHLV